ncbi:MAG: 5-(carboxyamino)imidazole ribonucleotide synthase [Verrucomicrobiota bacterium]
MPTSAQPAPRLGILGGGQLAKMTAAAAKQLGCDVVVLELPGRSLVAPALDGDWNDPAWTQKLAGLVDVVTLESEFVNLPALEPLPALFPSVATMRLVQDKLLQKQTFAAAGLPVPRFADTPTPDAVRQFGFPCVLKKRRNGYDGKGNATVRTADDLPAAWAKLDGALYVEEFCPFVRELAIIITRSQTGQVARYPVVETINRDHICHVTKAPISAPAAADMAERAIVAVGGVGSFGMELFELADGRLVINEIAPRVHNTGHYTIEACQCSQFENHVRAVLGWPLGSPALVAPAAAMVNLLGAGKGSGTPHGLAAALQVAGAHVHVYGKFQSAPGRKMGHVTALGNTIDEATAIAQRAANQIRFGD